MCTQTRNSWVSTSSDVWLRVLLAWSAVVPVGSCYSVDSALQSSVRPHTFCCLLGSPYRLCTQRSRRANSRPGWLGLASVGLLVQIGLAHYTAGMLKNGEAWSNGSALGDVRIARRLMAVWASYADRACSVNRGYCVDYIRGRRAARRDAPIAGGVHNGISWWRATSAVFAADTRVYNGDAIAVCGFVGVAMGVSSCHVRSCVLPTVRVLVF